MRIALDAMGGDHAPAEIVAGAERAIAEGHVTLDQVVLVGDRDRVKAELRSHEESSIEIIHAAETIGMDEHPGMALRKKRESSIVVGAKLLRDKHVDAFVSAGNTGAMVGAGTLVVKLLPGVRRPGIAAKLPAEGGSVMMIDVGANIHCQPEDLYTYGRMASEYRVGVDGIDRPRIGLLNIGEEEAKGGPLIQRTRELFHASTLNFTGNIEGQDVFSSRCDVIVCEGFVGNVVLKVSEGLGQYMTQLLAREVGRHANESSSATWREVGRSLMSKTDYAEYGGAPLLGVDGLVIICHGRSDNRAICNALRVSRQFIEARVNRNIVDRLANAPELRPSEPPAPDGHDGTGGGA